MRVDRADSSRVDQRMQANLNVRQVRHDLRSDIRQAFLKRVGNAKFLPNSLVVVAPVPRRKLLDKRTCRCVMSECYQDVNRNDTLYFSFSLGAVQTLRRAARTGILRTHFSRRTRQLLRLPPGGET